MGVLDGFARPFKVTYPPGAPWNGVVYQGAQFSDGRCIIALQLGGFTGATKFENLDLPPGSEVEWADCEVQP